LSSLPSSAMGFSLSAGQTRRAAAGELGGVRLIRSGRAAPRWVRGWWFRCLQDLRTQRMIIVNRRKPGVGERGVTLHALARFAVVSDDHRAGLWVLKTPKP